MIPHAGQWVAKILSRFARLGSGRPFLIMCGPLGLYYSRRWGLSHRRGLLDRERSQSDMAASAAAGVTGLHGTGRRVG